MNWAAVFWLVMLVIFLLAEAATVSLVSLWFAAGALTAMVIGLCHGALWLQIAGFVVVSVLLLLSLRPLVRRYVTPKLTKTNVDAIVGSTGLVTVAIDNLAAVGQVKLGAMVWSARSSSGEAIAAGTRVRVDKIEGVKALVSPAEVPVS